MVEQNDNLQNAEGIVQDQNLSTEVIENQSIADSIAQDSEEEVSKTEEAVPLKDYTSMSMEQLVDELEVLTQSGNVLHVRDHIEEVKKQFLNQFHELLNEKRTTFFAENTDENASFSFDYPLKNKFDALMDQIRNRRNEAHQQQQNALQNNLKNRLGIIEELKGVIDSGNTIPEMLKKVVELRERWKAIGPIPKDKYNHVWNNYHFHIERFYDYLHLDKEARDAEFRHNLEQKLRIITRAEELNQETDVPKAFKELQRLHRVWKEDIGPVSKELREEIWNKFSELTKSIHDKRDLLVEKLREKEVENLNRKNEIIQAIQAVCAEEIQSHNQWQNQIKKIEDLRSDFLKVGKVPMEDIDTVWNSFKESLKAFNTQKNNFYKGLKNEQQENLNRKLALIEQAKSLKDSEDFEAATPVFQKIQEEWKTIGHVPRKFSDELWADFKQTCNEYFERFHAFRKEANKESDAIYEQKKEYLESLKSFEFSGDHKTDLDNIKKHIETWKNLGKVSPQKRYIDRKFNKVLDTLFEQLSLSKKDSEMMRFNHHLENLKETDDKRRIDNEQLFITRKIDEIQSDVFQLENNIQFISSNKANNPLIKEVQKSIDKLKEELNTWKEKLKQIRSLGKAAAEQNTEKES